MNDRAPRAASAAGALGYAAAPHAHLIGGEWTAPPRGGSIDIVDPGNGTRIGTLAAGDAAVVDDAVRAARESFEDRRWRGLPSPHRAETLWRIGDLIAERAEDLAAIEALDNGMPLNSARVHVSNAVQCFRYHAGLADKIFGHTSQISSRGADYLGYSLKEPVGVAGLIVPWNAPTRQTVHKVAPALAVGCSVVLKPAEQTSLAALWLAALIEEAGVPGGVLNVVTGEGSPAGERLSSHPDVDKLSFTGSTQVGRQIIRASADTVKRLTLELGGKSPLVVFADADLDQAAADAATAIFDNSGQICSAASRLIVHKSVHAQIAERVAEIGRGLTLGYHTDEPNLGPLISARQLERVSAYVAEGLSDGAQVVGTPDNDLPQEGFFFRPTVLSGVKPDMSVAREEIFGPVLAAMTFADEDEAVALANDSEYGLAASVFTRDVARAHRMVGRLRAGRVGVNAHLVTDFTMPGGGYKQSGIGRENGPDSLDAYLETKAVFTRTS